MPNDTRCTGGALPAVLGSVDLVWPGRRAARHEPRHRSRRRRRIRRQRHDVQPLDRRRPDLGAGDPARSPTRPAGTSTTRTPSPPTRTTPTSCTRSGTACRVSQGRSSTRRTCAASASRARSTSPAPPTAATRWEPARKIYETGANKQTLGNQIVVSPRARAGRCSTSSATSPTLQPPRRDRPGQALLHPSPTTAARRGPSPRASTTDPDEPVPRGQPIDTEPFPCPDPRDQRAARSAPATCIPEVAVDRRNGNLYAVWMDARFDGGRSCRLRQHRVHASRPTAARPGRRRSRSTRRRTTEPNYDQQAFTPVGPRRRQRHGDGHLLRLPQQHGRPGDARHGLLRRPLRVRQRRTAPTRRAGRRSPHHARSFDIRKAPFARGYFLGDYMGLDNDGTDFPSLFGQAFAPNDASQYFSRLAPYPRGGGPARARRLAARRTCQ